MSLRIPLTSPSPSATSLRASNTPRSVLTDSSYAWTALSSSPDAYSASTVTSDPSGMAAANAETRLLLSASDSISSDERDRISSAMAP